MALSDARAAGRDARAAYDAAIAAYRAVYEEAAESDEFGAVLAACEDYGFEGGQSCPALTVEEWDNLRYAEWHLVGDPPCWDLLEEHPQGFAARKMAELDRDEMLAAMTEDERLDWARAEIVRLEAELDAMPTL